MNALGIRLFALKPWRAGLLGLAILTATADLMPARSEQTVLYRFGANEKDGTLPEAGLILDKSGALYGTTSSSGSGDGTVFKLSPPKRPSKKWTETVLYRFKGGKDGSLPLSRLVRDKNGALYGTTHQGGSDCNFGKGCGTVFKLTPPKHPSTKWTKTVLHRFAGENDGGNPIGALIFDESDALYGATYDYGCCLGGTVFKLTPSKVPATKWAHTVLYRFQGDEDGRWPYAGLVRDKKGALYGTTWDGQDGHAGKVFKLTPPNSPATSWVKTELYRFKGGRDGYEPRAGVILGKNGVLYGTTWAGGSSSHVGWGTVFSLTPPSPPATTSWTETVLYRFKGGRDGDQPHSDLVVDDSGSLYGTTNVGGVRYGTVFKLSPPTSASAKWTKTVLHRFRAGNNGSLPIGGLVRDRNGVLYGTTLYGGHNNCTVGCGTVFKVD